MKKCLLIYNVRTVGHFQVYAHNITLWALSRGLNVIYCGPAENTLYFKRYRTNKAVRLIDIGNLLNVDINNMDDETIVNELFSPDMAIDQLNCINSLQSQFSPCCTFLINTDDFIFNYPFEKRENSFHSPTFGILTFSNRNYYTGFEEIYSWRIREMLKYQSPFTVLFTLDEYHVKRKDPEQKYLKFLPDLYQEFDKGISCSAELSNKKKELTDFLNNVSFPILPIIGKFDDRKNNSLILELSNTYPELGFVIFGQREPSTKNDIKIDRIIEKLSKQNRVYKEFSFVDQALLDLLIAHPAVPFVPLPYNVHYGSSGIQLLAMKHCKPTLVPDNGLMGRRLLDSGAGVVFKTCDDDDFKQKCKIIFNMPPTAYKKEIAEFMKIFSRENLFSVLDSALDSTKQSPSLPGWTQAVSTANLSVNSVYQHYYQSLDAGNIGKYTVALEHLNQAIAATPNHSGMVFRKALYLFFQGNTKEASRIMITAGNSSELQFFISRMAEFVRAFPHQDIYLNPIRLAEYLLRCNTLDREQMKLEIEQMELEIMLHCEKQNFYILLKNKLQKLSGEKNDHQSEKTIKSTDRIITRRGVIWLGQTCNLRCSFCYFQNRITARDHPEHPFMSLEKAKTICSTLRAVYHNCAVDIQGGEPTIYPEIDTLVSHCAEIGLLPTLITNALLLDKRAKCASLKQAGINDLLISVHGLGDVYDTMCGVKGAHKRQMNALENLMAEKIPFRFNCVLSKSALPDLAGVAELAIQTGAGVVNFIAFNPFEDQQNNQRSIEDVPSYSEVTPPLIEAMKILRNADIECNVRYYPLCMVPEEFRKNLFNFQQLPYDMHEWDYASWSWSGEPAQRRREGETEKVFTLRQANIRSKQFGSIPDYLSDTAISLEDEYRHSALIRAKEHCGYQYDSNCSNCSLKQICDGFHGDYASLMGAGEAQAVSLEKEVTDPLYYVQQQKNIINGTNL